MTATWAAATGEVTLLPVLNSATIMSVCANDEVDELLMHVTLGNGIFEACIHEYLGCLIPSRRGTHLPVGREHLLICHDQQHVLERLRHELSQLLPFALRALLRVPPWGHATVRASHSAGAADELARSAQE